MIVICKECNQEVDISKHPWFDLFKQNNIDPSTQFICFNGKHVFFDSAINY